MLNIPVSGTRGLSGRFAISFRYQYNVQFEFAACIIGLYHSRLAQSWAGDGSGFSTGYSTNPILAAHYPGPEFTGSIVSPAFVAASPR